MLISILFFHKKKILEEINFQAKYVFLNDVVAKYL